MARLGLLSPTPIHLDYWKSQASTLRQIFQPPYDRSWSTSGLTADYVGLWRRSASLDETIIEGGPFKLLNYKVPYYLE
jgi:hypothetical protein